MNKTQKESSLFFSFSREKAPKKRCDHHCGITALSFLSTIASI